MTSPRTRQLLLVCSAIVGAALGYVLLQLLVGGRHEFPNQCFPQPSGSTICTLQGYGPRSYWVDASAGGIGAAVGLLSARLVTRARQTSIARAIAKADMTTR